MWAHFSSLALRQVTSFQQGLHVWHACCLLLNHYDWCGTLHTPLCMRTQIRSLHVWWGTFGAVLHSEKV